MRDLRVAAVIMRSGFGEIDTNLLKTERYARRAAQKGADIICFPELSITGYSLKGEIQSVAEPVPGPSSRAVLQMSVAHNIVILAGLVERTQGHGLAITQIVATPSGSIHAYRKIHLSPGEKKLFQPGNEVPVFTTKESIFGVQLCYDAHFPELSTVLALKGAEVFFISHASPAPESPRGKTERWHRYLSTRAYDNSVFVVACNQTGDSGSGITFTGASLIIDPRGEVLSRSWGAREKMTLADLKSRDLEARRSTRMGFFLASRRPEIYGGLASPAGKKGGE